jgi:hypothetical protein
MALSPTRERDGRPKRQVTFRADQTKFHEKLRYFTIYRDILPIKWRPGWHGRIAGCSGYASRKGGEMYGPGRIGYAGRGWRPGRPGPRGGYAPSFPVVGLAVGVAIFFLAVASLDFFPFIFFWWMIPFLLVPAIGLSARGIAGLVEARSRRPIDNERKEKELLRAMAQHGEITVAKAALETSLSVAEADRMLSGLAKDGHVEVRAREGRLGYALWEHDRRELTD